jgi:putative hydrolase of the HAD superfamily
METQLPDFDRLPEAVFFDLDHTILFYEDPDENWRTVCREFAPRVNMPVERIVTAIYKARDWYWGDLERHRRGRLDLLASRREVVALAFAELDLDSTDVARDLADAYFELRERGRHISPDDMDTLQYLKDCHVRMALVTNGAAEIQRDKIHQFGLADYFEHVLIEGEFGLGKPDERVFRHVLDQLGLSPSQAWMVGDDLERDIAGAQRAGLFTIWVDWRGRGLPESSGVIPERIVGSISELR